MWNNLKLNECSIEHNYLMSDQGRIWVLYDIRVVSLVVVKSNLQFIHCRITWGEKVFYWTCVYESYYPMKRRELSRNFTRVGSTLSNLNNLWIIQGDFNVVCSNEDITECIPVKAEAAMEF